jgi:hypothetical protein
MSALRRNQSEDGRWRHIYDGRDPKRYVSHTYDANLGVLHSTRGGRGGKLRRTIPSLDQGEFERLWAMAEDLPETPKSK